MAVDPKLPLDPPRANAVIFALRFRAELYGQYQAREEVARLQMELQEMRAILAERLR